jgi:hypothetical protein
MSAFAGITCNDANTLAALTAWLDESRMRIPAGLKLRIDVVGSVTESEDPREIFPQGDVDIRAGEPLGWVHLTWRAAPAWARIEADRAEATIQLSHEAVAQMDYLLRSFMLVTFIFLFKRDHRYHMHAATAIDPRGRGWMLIGNSCSGKSTTSALLAARGWQVSTDDIAFVTASGDRVAVEGFRSPLALREGGQKLLRMIGGTPFPERAKQGFLAEEIGGHWVQTVEPELILFTSVGGTTTTLVPAPKAEIIREMMQWSMWVMFEPTAAQEHLDLIMRLGAQARCFRASFAPDLFDAPNALEDFLP